MSDLKIRNIHKNKNIDSWSFKSSAKESRALVWGQFGFHSASCCSGESVPGRDTNPFKVPSGRTSRIKTPPAVVTSCQREQLKVGKTGFNSVWRVCRTWFVPSGISHFKYFLHLNERTDVGELKPQQCSVIDEWDEPWHVLNLSQLMEQSAQWHRVFHCCSAVWLYNNLINPVIFRARIFVSVKDTGAVWYRYK